MLVVAKPSHAGINFKTQSSLVVSKAQPCQHDQSPKPGHANTVSKIQPFQQSPKPGHIGMVSKIQPSLVVSKARSRRHNQSPKPDHVDMVSKTQPLLVVSTAWLHQHNQSPKPGHTSTISKTQPLLVVSKAQPCQLGLQILAITSNSQSSAISAQSPKSYCRWQSPKLRHAGTICKTQASLVVSKGQPHQHNLQNSVIFGTI